MMRGILEKSLRIRSAVSGRIRHPPVHGFRFDASSTMRERDSAPRSNDATRLAVAARIVAHAPHAPWSNANRAAMSVARRLALVIT